MTDVELLPVAAPGETPVRVMTIAGSDSGGGAGIQADMRTFALLGLHGCVAVTAVTVQNSLGVSGFQEIAPETVAAQIATVVDDIGVGAAKTGMLASAPIIDAVVAQCSASGIGRDGSSPLVVDPVCASMHGNQLLADSALDTLRANLFPLATVVTPNLDEVRLITGVDVVDTDSQRDAAKALFDLGPAWALVKGGHLRSCDHSPDLLYDGAEFIELNHERIDTTHDHGAGDTLAAAITCALAHDYSVPDAVSFAKKWVTRGLAAAYPLGAGHGPVNPLWRVSDPS
ncbi:bifunctional hydroxymethylpyrimidine kinase/phosphomethylpyrimidine kinase [Gordonia rubripertincta]|uniref:Bifunctional hydroxymethylpyrimidine kinase/phosphomethylpyrimidine kinase n=1 Tax=Gordonia rubripertincta TaxID=36822 RepID=A0AAW4GBJ8_GORRU|nr:bifunctional hydroxymethylpyrimidine kinase/phosphomethylpyrimidine kinase [Gordonia rubripertincta]MBM7280409.1 bifunctional hydroxymethylpyrimidine kinase/phosphomethylpyrimidine kinase [Gordonia rubripertincta]